jgi:predicted transcriptional regulator
MSNLMLPVEMNELEQEIYGIVRHVGEADVAWVHYQLSEARRKRSGDLVPQRRVRLFMDELCRRGILQCDKSMRPHAYSVVIDPVWMSLHLIKPIYKNVMGEDPRILREVIKILKNRVD